MTTETTTFDVAATPEQIKLGFREPASDVKVLVRDKDQTPYQNRSLERRGWKRASADEATYLCEVTEEEKRLEPGQAIVVTAEWTASGAAHRDEKIVTVVEETPDDPSAEQRQETVDDTRAELRQETVEETPDDPSAELRQETPDDTRAELRQETVEETLDDTWAEEPEANIEEYGLPTGDTNGDAGVVTPAAGSIDAFQTECGVMLYFPCQIEASELEIALAPDRASLRLQERGWKVRPVGTQAVECLPLTREAIGSGDLSLSVRYFCAGEPREEMLSVTLSNGAGYTAPGPAGVDQQAPSAHKPPTEAYAPATPGGAGPGGGSGPGGGGGGPGGIPGGGGPGGGGGGPGGIPGGAAAFLGASAIGGGSIADIFKVPLRVRDGVVTGGGEDLAAWRDSVIENVFQTLPPRPAATQFRDSLAAAFGAFTPPSAYGPGVMPFAGPAPAWSAATGGASPGYVPPWIASQSTSGGGSGSPYGLTAASPPLSMGQLTGPFADLASIADALELNAVPAARDLTALTQNADLDEVEAERVLVQDALASLIDELRQPSPDGPQRSVALAYVQRLSTHVNLLGQTAEIVNSSGQFGTDAVTPLDFANVSRFRVLVQWATIAQVAVQQFAPNVVDAPAIVGRVKQLLGVVAEKSRELELEFDIADFGPLERSRFSVTPTTVGPLAAQGGPVPDPIIFARLLDWMQEQASRNLPRLLDTSGNRAGGTVRDTLATQAAYAEELVNLGTRSGVFPFTHPIIARIVGELLTYVSDAFTEAGHL